MGVGVWRAPPPNPPTGIASIIHWGTVWMRDAVPSVNGEGGVGARASTGTFQVFPLGSRSRISASITCSPGLARWGGTWKLKSFVNPGKTLKFREEPYELVSHQPVAKVDDGSPVNRLRNFARRA